MLKDVLKENLKIVFCGTAKGKASARLGFYYAGPGNKFYKILHDAGFTPLRLLPRECFEIDKYEIGLTDLVHIQCGNDNEIDDDSYDVSGFVLKMETYRPKVIAFTSKKAASFALGFKGITSMLSYGLYKHDIGDSKVFILPSTSGSGRKFWDDKYWHDLKTFVAFL